MAPLATWTCSLAAAFWPHTRFQILKSRPTPPWPGEKVSLKLTTSSSRWMRWATHQARSTRLLLLTIISMGIRPPTKRIGLNSHRGKCNSQAIRSLMEQKRLMNTATEITLWTETKKDLTNKRRGRYSHVSWPKSSQTRPSSKLHPRPVSRCKTKAASHPWCGNFQTK